MHHVLAYFIDRSYLPRHCNRISMVGELSNHGFNDGTLSDRDSRTTLLVLEGLDRVGVSDPQGADHDDADDYGQHDDVGGDEEQR